MIQKNASFMVDEFQLRNIEKLCEKYNRTLSDIVRIAIRNVAVTFKGESNIPTSYRNIKKGVRLNGTDIKALAYVMKKFKIKNISEACRVCLLLFLMKYQKDLN